MQENVNLNAADFPFTPYEGQSFAQGQVAQLVIDVMPDENEKHPPTTDVVPAYFAAGKWHLIADGGVVARGADLTSSRYRVAGVRELCCLPLVKIRDGMWVIDEAAEFTAEMFRRFATPSN